jgi:hypothetical protein
LAELHPHGLVALQGIAEGGMLKGALHVHSTYSDGEFSLPELRELFLSEGCRFVCMTDHAEYFDERKLRKYADECRSLSDEKLCLVNGLEYNCERQMHILGYGARALTSSKDPQNVVRHIDAQGAISVIAHPRDNLFSWIESFETLPQGIEAWNSKYDGRYAPRPATFGLVRRLQTRRAGLHAFYGQDLHWKKQFHGLFVSVNIDAPQPASIISALARGEFCGQKKELCLPSSGVLAEELLEQFSRAQLRSRSFHGLLKKGKRALDQLGIKVPESLKARVRRVL